MARATRAPSAGWAAPSGHAAAAAPTRDTSHRARRTGPSGSIGAAASARASVAGPSFVASATASVSHVRAGSPIALDTAAPATMSRARSPRYVRRTRSTRASSCSRASLSSPSQRDARDASHEALGRPPGAIATSASTQRAGSPLAPDHRAMAARGSAARATCGSRISASSTPSAHRSAAGPASPRWRSSGAA